MSTWIITTDPEIDGLLDLAAGLPDEIVLAIIGDESVAEAAGDTRVGRIERFDTSGAPAESAAHVLAEQARDADARLVLATAKPAHQVVAGVVAARLAACLFTEVQSIAQAAGDLVVTHAVHTGIAQETVAVTGTVVALSDSGGLPSHPGPVASHLYPVPTTMTIIDRPAPRSDAVDITKAERLVVAGRGVKSSADLAVLNRIAELLGAELACSRPLAEGLGWFSHDRYIGVSGQTVRPRLYFAVGVSGQLSHIAGARDADVIVAVNIDAGAPIFNECDLGVVADLYELLPAFESVLRARDAANTDR